LNGNFVKQEKEIRMKEKRRRSNENPSIGKGKYFSIFVAITGTNLGFESILTSVEEIVEKSRNFEA
jgi:hypothetical protein